MKILIAILKLILFTIIAVILFIPKIISGAIKLIVAILTIIRDTIVFLIDRVESEVKNIDNGTGITKNKGEKVK